MSNNQQGADVTAAILKDWQKRAIIYQEETYTYTELLQIAHCYANAFTETAVPQKIAIFAENSPEWIFAFYGAVCAGATVVPIDILSSAKEVAYILEDCRPDIVFTSPKKRAMLEEAVAMQEGCKCRIVTPDEVDLTARSTMSAEPITPADPDATLLIIYTSGTTGSPKGVMLTYRNAVFNVNSVSVQVPIFLKERNVMILLPLHHAFPLMGSMIAPLFVGGTVCIADGMTAESVLDALNRGKINIIIGVPRLYDMLTKGIMGKINSSKLLKVIYNTAKLIGSQRLSRFIFKSVHKKFGGHIEYLVSGGAALSNATAEVFKALGFYVLEGYGMTETAPMISFTRPGERKIGYVGKPLPGIDIMFSEAGEICVRGDNVMKGYYHREKETADIIRDGWLHTGDRGELDKYGLRITGRIKEIIVTPNGKNINPEELEHEMLHFSKAFKEVGIFMHDDILQAVILPEVQELRDKYIENMEKVLKATVAEFNQTLPSYKHIKRIHIVSSELPKTRLGKVQRFKLADLINGTTQKEAEDDSQRSKTYLILKQYVESETGMTAHADDHFEIDLAMDSLSRIALMAFVQSVFGVEIAEEQFDSVNTLNLLSHYVEEQQQSRDHQRKEVSWKQLLLDKLPDIKLPKPGIIQFFSSLITRFLVRIVYRCRVTGRQNIPSNPCIIVANHRSALDGVLVAARMPFFHGRKTYFFAKAKHWKSNFARFMAEKNNVILMDINKNLTESIQQMAAALKLGKNVIIFPEGTRSQDTKLNEFKETFAILSCTLNVPVLPVVIQGAETAVHEKVALPRFLNKINITILPLISPSPNQEPKTLKNKVEQLYHDFLEGSQQD